MQSSGGAGGGRGAQQRRVLACTRHDNVRSERRCVGFLNADHICVSFLCLSFRDLQLSGLDERVTEKPQCDLISHYIIAVDESHAISYR